MQNLITRLDKDTFEIVYFGNDTIINKPVEEWPVCDVLMAFYSDGIILLLLLIRKF